MCAAASSAGGDARDFAPPFLAQANGQNRRELAEFSSCFLHGVTGLPVSRFLSASNLWTIKTTGDPNETV
ncbi:MAG: hypothetical protein FalmKO_17200 [Falsiruegeria mediterranea]